MQNPTANRLLAALPAPLLQYLGAELQPLHVAAGRAVYEPGSLVSHLVFPTSGVVSVLKVNWLGSSAQLGLVGSEGVLGIAPLLASERALDRAVVQSACTGYRLSVRVAKPLFSQSGAFQTVMLRFLHAYMAQVSQTVLCNRHHTVEQQLCRWLLLHLDRLPSNRLEMTQEAIANTLGVRRQGVTEAAQRLERSGILKNSRGSIIVGDRTGLEARACECYTAVKQTERLVP